ncbi:hypothetical protein [Nonomuraea jiangxiensis]|uniref:Uncharacterized protein n=1 Tax=Nonomuraea jiangxiensis TaxID=633440 RepID=A0A1G8ICV3_9ACTN|nr:hypothetical protein [Nonomuraea jiangxiensis]SDI16724.1 hypothetical protein SAMN05421869_104450 [Nonomuraea jiangxiensis]
MNQTDTYDLRDPDFLALGMGATNMVAMLWTVAMGRRAVGVDMRGDPSLGVHWNVREELYHHLGLIDRLMLERYGEEGLPRRGNGTLFRLSDSLYRPDWPAGPVATDELVCGFTDTRIGGLIHHTEFIDDRWRDGAPHRQITLLDAPRPPDGPDPGRVERDMVEVLDSPSTFQTGAFQLLMLLRRYLELIEEQDLARGVEPRVRLFTNHRVVEDGFVELPDGRRQVLIEELRELDFRGKFHRVRAPGTGLIDLGVPKLFMIAQGFTSADADRLGFRQEDVCVDHNDGKGPVVAQADYLAGLLGVLVDGRLRRRIASEFDEEGNEYWVRQIAVGHEGDPAVGWVLVQVPDFKVFDPIETGLVPPGTDRDSVEYYAAYRHMLRDYYLEQTAAILEMPKEQLARVAMTYGPKLFSLVERVGKDALVAPNGVVGGDSFGNGHFMTSGGAMTGMIGHAHRVLRYWEATDAGVGHDAAIRSLADGIRADTHSWLQVSATEFSQALPINFGAERIEEIVATSGADTTARATTIESSRRLRHSLIPLDPSDWLRPVLTAGRMHAMDLPPLARTHPAARTEAQGGGDGVAVR